MSDPQPSKANFDMTQPKTYPKPILGFTNHVRVGAAHDREHSCHNSFRLCRGCTCSPWVMIILGKLNTHCTDKHPYTLPRCVPGSHYKVVQLFHLACNVPTEVLPPVWASHPPRSPSCALWVPTVSAIPTLSHSSAIAASLNIPAVLLSQLPRTTGWYAKTRLYHKLCQVVPI
jgi:hypothetical protein